MNQMHGKLKRARNVSKNFRWCYTALKIFKKCKKFSGTVEFIEERLNLVGIYTIFYSRQMLNLQIAHIVKVTLLKLLLHSCLWLLRYVRNCNARDSKWNIGADRVKCFRVVAITLHGCLRWVVCKAALRICIAVNRCKTDALPDRWVWLYAAEH